MPFFHLSMHLQQELQHPHYQRNFQLYINIKTLHSPNSVSDLCLAIASAKATAPSSPIELLSINSLHWKLKITLLKSR